MSQSVECGVRTAPPRMPLPAAGIGMQIGALEIVMSDAEPQLWLFRYPPETRQRWRDFPIRIMGPRSKCHRSPTLLVRSMSGGFITANCSTCGKAQMLTASQFIAVNGWLWIGCPTCNQRMRPTGNLAVMKGGRTLAGNYGYMCQACGTCINAADILPGWQEVVSNAFRHKPITDLALSTRARLSLARASVKTVGGLCQLSADDLLEIRNFGSSCLLEVRNQLAKVGLSLRGDG